MPIIVSPQPIFFNGEPISWVAKAGQKEGEMKLHAAQLAASTQPLKPTKAQEEIYVVKAGDSWESIAKKFAITAAQLKRANHQTYSDQEPLAGQTIVLPKDTLGLPDLGEPSPTKDDKAEVGALTTLKQAMSKDTLAADIQSMANNPGKNQIGNSYGIDPNVNQANAGTNTNTNTNTIYGNNPNDSSPQTTDNAQVGRGILIGVANSAVNAEIQAQVDKLKKEGKDYPLISNLKLSFNPTFTGNPGSNWINDWSADTIGPLYKWQKTALNVQLGTRQQYQRNYGDVGLVLRRILPNQRYMVGLNTFVDQDFTGGNERYSLGGEFFAPNFKSSANLYQRITGWRVSPFNFLREERIANGFDLNLTGYVPNMPSLSVTGTYFQYFGNQVDVMHNGVFMRDPTGYQIGLTWAPVPLYQVSVTSTQSGGQSSAQLGFALNYALGQPLAKQLQLTTNADVSSMTSHLNDFVVRNYTPVLEERDRKFPISFANGTVYVQNNRASTTLRYTAPIQGGYGAMTYTLSGADQSVFQFNPITKTLTWLNDATGPVLNAPGHSNQYTTTLTVNDAYGDSASQVITINLVSSALPTASDLSMQKSGVNPLGDNVPRVGNDIVGQYKFNPPTTSPTMVEKKDKTQYQWYLDGKKIEGATAQNYTVVESDFGKHLGFSVRVAGHDPKTPDDSYELGDWSSVKDFGAVGVSVLTPTSVSITLNGKPIDQNAPVISKSASGKDIGGTPLTASLSCYADSTGKNCTGGGKITYQWQHWTSETDKTFTDISGATASTYAPTFADLGRGIKVIVNIEKSGPTQS